MKTIARIVLLVLFLFAFALPVLAQDTTAVPVPDDATAGTPIIVIPPSAVDNGTVVAIGALIVLAITVIIAITRGASADKAVTVALQALQTNREAMSRYETMYTESQETVRQGFDAVAGVVRALAPLTPWEADDELVDALEDVRAPGPPAAG